MILRFEQWLAGQQHRQDPIGDLARVPGMQNIDHKASKRKSDEHKGWADIVIRLADPVHIDVFNDAWQEFLMEKLTVAESPV